MRILLGMSGGVDSTYAAKKLKDAGHEVEGALLVMHPYTDIESAKRAASEIGIKLHVVDCRERFESIVINNFVSEYSKGRTPNPCVICNKEVKFKCLQLFAKEQSFDKIATGHYAKVCSKNINGEERYFITRAQDKSKDQSYMLWRLPQDVLRMLILPLAEEEKKEIVSEGKKAGISSAEAKESQEICFLPDGNHTAFIEKQIGECAPGRFIDEQGHVLGEHRGIVRYTVGQRKGLNIALGRRVFVTEINADDNTVTLSDAPLVKSEVRVGALEYSKITEKDVAEGMTFGVKLRYLARVATASVRIENGIATVNFSEPQKSPTPGQSAVFYDGEDVAFGGIIL